MEELSVRHLGCVPWENPGDWTAYVRSIEDMLGAEITHLDTHDPVKRKVAGRLRCEIGDYITAFGKREDSRWVFGRMDAIDLEFTIQHYQTVTGFPNSISWHFSEQFLGRVGAFDTVANIFDLGNERLSTFYGFADWNSVIAAKNKDSGAVDIQAELLGVFWLTYFDHRYVTLIGEHVFDALSGERTATGGATLRLAVSPEDVSDSARRQSEIELGEKRFVNPKDYSLKRPGEFVLTFEQLQSTELNSI